jgi:hypothetical protein
MFHVFFVMALLLTNSCKKENMCDCFKSTGADKTEYRSLSGFTKIELHNNVDLIITPGKPFACEVTAGSHLVSMVTTEVSGQTLIIRNENRCNWVRSFQNKFTVEVSMPSIDYIYFTGSGHVVTKDTIKGDIFTMDGWTCSGSMDFLFNCNTTWLSFHTGTADLKAAGRSGVSYVYNAGAGPMDCTSLETGYTYITNKSTNDCSIYATKEIGATINLQGNIYYHGEPYKIDQTVTGSGRLIKR